MSKKKVSASVPASSSLALEDLINKTFAEEIARQVRGLLAQAAQNSDSYLMKEIEKRLNMAPTEAPKANAGDPFPAMVLDEDEIKIKPQVIKAAASKLEVKESSFKSWAVEIDGKKYPPKHVYRAAFEAEGFKVDWDFTTYRALSLLAHHGFKCVRV